MPEQKAQTPGPVRHWRAEPAAVIAEHAQALTRIDAVAEDILRVRVAPSGVFTRRQAWDQFPAMEQLPAAADGSSPGFDLSLRCRLRVEERGRVLHLATGALRASVDLDSGAISLSTGHGAAFASDVGPARWRAVDRNEVARVAPALAPALDPARYPTPDSALAPASPSALDPDDGAGLTAARAPEGNSDQRPPSGPAQERAVDPNVDADPTRQVDAGWPGAPASIGLWLEKALHPQEGIYGCGQRFGPLDRRGQRLAHWTTDIHSPGLGVVDGCLYQSHPVLLALRPRLAWGLMLGSNSYSHFDLGAEDAETLGLFTFGGELDYYLFAGPTPAAVVEQITRLTGRPALPPLWAHGYHQSRWGYRSDAEIRGIANEFRSRRIPIDAIHLDIDYMDGFRVFSWDRTRFTNPRATVDALHRQGIRAVTIIDPGVKRERNPPRSYPVYEAGLRGDHFIRRSNGEPFAGYVWPGESLFPDFCKTATQCWWGDLHAGLLDAGVDGIWCDMNEPAIADRPFGTPGETALSIPLDTGQGDETNIPHLAAHNAYGALMAQATYEGLERLRPARRPWVLTRSARIGAQRWAVSWMGDNASTWEDLRTSLPQLANMGLSGSPQVGVDIGGFFGACDGELFARWIELGAFYPFMRGHAFHGSPPQEPWAFGDSVEAVARTAIERRYRFLPYLYSLSHRAHRSGEPILRPLLYDFPEEPALHAIEDQVMVGPLLMIAPVCEPGVSEREVRLPPGVWYDFHSGGRIDPIRGQAPAVDSNDRRHRLAAPPGRMPILVRGGSCLTLGPARQSTREPLNELILDAYPDAKTDGGWSLIEDAGDGWGYREGAIAETAFTLAADERGPVLRIGARRGAWRLRPRRLVLRMHLEKPPRQVLLDGTTRSDWQWDQARRAMVIALADGGSGHRLSVE